MPGNWDVYVKSGVICIAALLLNLAAAHQLQPYIHDSSLRWGTACALLQVLAIAAISLYLLARRAWTRVMESLYEQLRPAMRERVHAMALTGERWSVPVPKHGPARRVLEETVVHVLAGLTESGRFRVAQFAIQHGFRAQWIKNFKSPHKGRRQNAIARLGLLADEEAGAVIQAGLKDPDACVRIEAARALLLRGDLFMVDQVFRSIVREPLLARALLAGELKRHARYLLPNTVPALLVEGTLEITRCLEFMIAWERAMPSFDVEPFLNTRCSPEVWSLVLKMLPYVPLEESVEDHLRSALNSTDLDVRCSAARAAGHLKLQQLIPYLSEALNQDAEFALASAGALARIGVSGEKKLERIVSGPDRKAAAVAMEALEQLAVGLR